MRHLLTKDIRIPAAIISMLFTAWCVYIDPVINNDGFLYILVADSIREGNFREAFSQYRWPFYSFFIAGFGHVLNMSSENSAFILNALFSSIIVISFISIIKVLNDKRKLLIFAAIVILLYPGINAYRSFIIRDFGYLAFYFLGLWAFFKHMLDPQWYLILLWSVLLVIAALFRIEGIVLLICMPFIAWFVFEESKPQRKKIVVALCAVLTGFFLLLAWWFSGNDLDQVDNLGLASGYSLILKYIWQLGAEYQNRINILQDLLAPYSEQYAIAMLSFGFVVILFTELISRITLVHVFLVAYGWRMRTLFPSDRIRSSWMLLLGVQLVILVGIMLQRYFLTGRFPLAFSLTFLIFIPFVLVRIFDVWKEADNASSIKKRLFPFVLFFLVIYGFQGLGGFTSKVYQKEGGLWIKQKINPNEQLLSNEAAVVYYAGRNPYKRHNVKEWKKIYTYDWDIVSRILRSNKGKDYKYIAIGIKRKNKISKQEIISLVGSSPIKRLKNDSGDELLIFIN